MSQFALWQIIFAILVLGLVAVAALVAVAYIILAIVSIFWYPRLPVNNWKMRKCLIRAIHNALPNYVAGRGGVTVQSERGAPF